MSFLDPHVARMEAIFSHVEIVVHVERVDEIAIEIVKPRMVRATEYLCVATFFQLADRQPIIIDTPIFIVSAQS
jgi:hypothetical protein